MNFDAIVERWHQLWDQMAQIAALENLTAEDERRMHGLAKEFDRADAERLRIERGGGPSHRVQQRRGEYCGHRLYKPGKRLIRSRRLLRPDSGTQVKWSSFEEVILGTCAVFSVGDGRRNLLLVNFQPARSAIERMPVCDDLLLPSAAANFVNQRDTPDGVLSRQVLARARILPTSAPS